MMKWPLGINPQFDEIAAKEGYPHWCCTDPMGNANWIRQDGEVLRPTFRLAGGYPDELKQFDKDYSMGQCVFGNLKPGDIIEMPGQGYIQWVTEEEAVPQRMLWALRQREIRRVIDFTRKKYS